MQVLATICEELPPDCVVLVYLSASGLHLLCLFKYSLSLMSCYTRLVTLMITYAGKAGLNNVSQVENFSGSSKYSRHKVLSQTSQGQNSEPSETQNNGKRELSYYDNYLWFGPKGNSG